ncbi:MAG: DEAD/DEAH box helicase [Prevotella sp.]|nr:DEAD/DEAH box helicase [Prevotella sp.]MCM1074758.1 DEAD/DEAH box helicase [Ruminococcus sp.]
MKQDFLSALRVHNNIGDNASSLKNPAKLRVQIKEASTGGALFAIVDSTGVPQSASEYIQEGAIGPLLRTVSELERNNGMDFSWTDSGADLVYSTRDYPFLTSFLPQCKDLLVDADMKPLTLNDTPRRVLFKLETVGKDEENKQIVGQFLADNEKINFFLSGKHALCGDKILTVNDIGSRFADTGAFTEPFDLDMAESFLSIFFTFLSDTDVDFAGRAVRRTDEPVDMTSILLFEKIESDNSLCMRVSEQVGNIPMDICENFLLHYYVTLTDVKIYVRPIAGSTIEDNVKLVYNSIVSCISKREQKGIWTEGNRIVITPEIASAFLFNSFASLLPRFTVLGAEKLKKYKIVAGMPKFNLKLGSGIDFLEGKASVEVDGEKFTVSDLLAQYSKHRYVKLNDGNRAVMDPKFMKRLGRIFHKADSKVEDVKISFFDLPEVMQLLEETGEPTKEPPVYRKFYEGFNNLKNKKLTAPKLKAKLRDYQTDGLKWINYLYDSNMGGCLADDMGLGKTVQTIAMLTRCVPKQTKPTLIVMPPSLLFNWQEEFRKFAPHLNVVAYYGSERNLEKALQAQVILTSYPLVRNDIEQFVNHEFSYIILDESQNIKNVDALVTKAVWLLKGEHRLAISGTPIENNLTELYSLFRFLNPAMFGSIQEFSNIYAAPIQKEGDEDAAKALRLKVFPFILRRLKKDVLSDLPERVEQVLTVEMSAKQAAFYEERRAYYAQEVATAMQDDGHGRASFELLQALSELRQIASVPETKTDGRIASPKIELLMEYLINAVKNGHKVVAFYNFLAGIELTAEHLDRAGIEYETMTGATRDRQKVVENFQNNPDCKVLLMTVKTGGVGLNLTAADTVFVVEPWWNKAAEEQAINRLHRIGQKNSVNCYYLITADTIEEKIRSLQEKKSALVDAVISSDTGSKSLTAEDISFLLS